MWDTQGKHSFQTLKEKLMTAPVLVLSNPREPFEASRFWESLNRALGTKFRLSSAYHPQTNGQTEWTIQSLEDLLRACVLEQQGSWESFLPLIEFTYNNSFHLPLAWLPMKLCMVEGVGHPYVG